MRSLRQKRNWFWVASFPLLVAALLGAQTFPVRPGPRDFILDEANLIDAGDEAEIRAVCDKLLRETQTPIVVVTIPSLAKYRGKDIESYARALFDSWGIGSQQRNYGVLLLVSVGDRKARIELGAAWAGTKDDTAAMIMNDIIVPNFKQGKFSAGILQGVQALDTMVRGSTVVSPRQRQQMWIFWGAMILGVALAISLIRSGRAGWGWALLGILGAILVAVLVAAMRGGGGGSGSFGGGSGGGGGATGSW